MSVKGHQPASVCCLGERSMLEGDAQKFSTLTYSPPHTPNKLVGVMLGCCMARRAVQWSLLIKNSALAGAAGSGLSAPSIADKWSAPSVCEYSHWQTHR